MEQNYIKINNDNEVEEYVLSPQIKEYKRNYIAEVPQLNTFGYSDQSKNDAIYDLKNALEVFFNIHKTRNDLEYILKKFNWGLTDVFKNGKIYQPSYIITSIDKIDFKII